MRICQIFWDDPLLLLESTASCRLCPSGTSGAARRRSSSSCRRSRTSAAVSPFPAVSPLRWAAAALAASSLGAPPSCGKLTVCDASPCPGWEVATAVAATVRAAACWLAEVAAGGGTEPCTSYSAWWSCLSSPGCRSTRSTSSWTWGSRSTCSGRLGNFWT